MKMFQYITVWWIIWLYCHHIVSTVRDVTRTDENRQIVLLSDLGPYGNEAKTVKFQVEGCRDSHIIFSPLLRPTIPSDPYYYVIVGGYGNTKNVLAHTVGGYVDVDEHFSSELQCGQLKDFWVRFEHWMIQVGRGSVIGDGVFLSYDEECEFKIRSIEVFTAQSAPGHEVLWRFFDIEESNLTLTTNSRSMNAKFTRVITCPTFDVLTTMKTNSGSLCGKQCITNADCSGFQYSKENNVCTLVSDIAVSNGLATYYKKFN